MGEDKNSNIMTSRFTQSLLKAQMDKPFWVGCFGLILLAMYFQIGVDFTPSSLKTTVRWGHIIYPLIAFFLLSDIRKIKPLSPPMIYFITAAIFTGVAYFRYGLNIRVYIFLYAAIVYFIGTAFSRRLQYKTVTRMFRGFLLAYLCIIIMRDFIWIGLYGQTNLYGLPEVEGNTFIVGGLNSESALLAVSSAFFLNNYIFAGLAIMVIASISSSRSTFILWGIASSIAFFRMLRTRDGKISLRPFFLVGLIIIGIWSMLAIYDVQIFKRFSELGSTNDSGNTRIMLLISATVLILQNPFGYGFGNAMPLVFDTWSGIGGILRRDTATLENFVFQMALDTGVITLCVYFYMMYRAISLYRRHRKFTEFFIFMVLFWISNLFGGGGGNEPAFWIICGMFFTYCENETTSSTVKSSPNFPSVSSIS